MPEHVVRAHAPLQVFVSSGMQTELEEHARTICFEHLARDPFTPWLFEYTPATAESASDAYLSAVERSDIVIWLVGSRTSPAVQRELQHGLDRQKRFLVFCLPAGDRDEETENWLIRMRGSFKTKDVAVLDYLGLELNSALNDLLVSAVRASSTPTVADELAVLERRLRAIAMTRWMAVGVSTEKARELASDLAVGALHKDALPTRDEPFRVIQAPVGAGKTIAAVRFLQRAVARANSEPNAPFPVWVEAPREGQSPDREVEEALAAAGRPRRSPVTVVVDGLDELPAGVASLILEKARILASSDDANEVLLTSRPTGLDVQPEELSSVAELSLDDSVALIHRAFGVQLSTHQLQVLPTSVRTALARPLFSLLLGRRVATDGMGTFAIGDLIATLVTDAIGRVARDELSANRDLASLAMASLDRAAQAIDPRTVGDGLDVRGLVDTRLVIASERGVSFSLPILREWFGGVALQMGLVTATELVGSPSRLERWRYALYMALATLPATSVDAMMRTLARSLPGFASEAMAATAWQADAGLPSGEVLGGRLRDAMESLVLGLRDVGGIIGPHVDDQIATLGIRLSPAGLTYAWSRSATDPSVVTLPEEFSLGPARDPNWDRRRLRGAVSADPLWPWRVARDDLRDLLEGVLTQRVLFPDVAETRAEAAWLVALHLQPIGEHFYGPLNASHIRLRLRELGDLDLLKAQTRLVPLGPLRDQLADGNDLLVCPYEVPDAARNSWVWSGFSGAALLRRTRAVYAAAIAIYEAFVDYFFAGFDQSLRLHRLLPARLHGSLRPEGPSGGMEAAPELIYTIDPLPRGHQSVIDIDLATSGSGGAERERTR